VVCSLNDQHRIVGALREANLLDLFDIVVDAKHMLHLKHDKGLALNELLLPLFPFVDPGDVLFVDDSARKIREVKVSAPACKTFMCSSYGLSSADMRLLLNEEGRDVEMSERIRKEEANEAQALWEGGDAGLKELWCNNARKGLKNAMQTGIAADLKRAIDRASRGAGSIDRSDDESDVALLEHATEALAALEAEDIRDVKMP